MTGDTLVFTFTGTTWDGIDFSGQMMCANMGWRVIPTPIRPAGVGL